MENNIDISLISQIKNICDMIISFGGAIAVIFVIIRYFLHFLFREKKVDSSIKIIDMPEESFFDNTQPPITFYYDESEENTSEVTMVYSKDSVIRKLLIYEMIYKKKKLKKGKLLKVIEQVPPNTPILIYYNRPCGCYPKLSITWNDKTFLSASYLFNYNGFNGYQSEESIVYKETFWSIIAKIFYF
jgi:hypothetical protein